MSGPHEHWHFCTYVLGAASVGEAAKDRPSIIPTPPTTVALKTFTALLPLGTLLFFPFPIVITCTTLHGLPLAILFSLLAENQFPHGMEGRPFGKSRPEIRAGDNSSKQRIWSDPCTGSGWSGVRGSRRWRG